MDIQKRIRTLRQTLGYTQQEFADKLEIAKPTISAWERGSHVVPPSRLYQLCETFHVRRNWLESGSGPMFGNNKARLTRVDVFLDVAIQLYRALPEEEQDVVYRLARKILEIRNTNTNPQKD